MMLETTSDVALDALREVANIGCGHAANALSRMMGGGRVDIDLPTVSVAPIEQAKASLRSGPEEVVATTLGVEGELSGKLVVLLAPEAADQMATALLGSTSATPAEARSALEEMANILASACLTAVGTLTGLRLLPSPPSLSREASEKLWGFNLEGVRSDGEPVLCLETRFHVAGPSPLHGRLVLLLGRGGTKALLKRLGL